MRLSDPQLLALALLASVHDATRAEVQGAAATTVGGAQRVLDALYRRGLVTAAVPARDRCKRGTGQTFRRYSVTEKGLRRFARATT